MTKSSTSPAVAPEETRRELAEQVREAVLLAVAEGFEAASISGLCSEGALENALGRARSLDLGPLIRIEGAPPLGGSRRS